MNNEEKSLSRNIFSIWVHGTEDELQLYIQKNNVNSDVISRFLIMVEGYSIGTMKKVSISDLDKKIRDFKGI